MAQLKDLIVTGPSRFLNDLYALTIYEGGVKLEDKYYLASNPSGYISDLSTAINGLPIGTSNANRNDYAVVQSAGGGTSDTSYYRRPISKIFAALISDDIPNLAASKITSGTFDAARIPSLSYTKITGISGTSPIGYSSGAISLSYDSTLQLLSNKLSVTNPVPIGTVDDSVLLWNNDASEPCWSSLKLTTSSTSWSTSSDVNVPTMKAISSYVTGLGYTTNAGTVTSVRVQASSPLTSTSSSASTTTLDTTIKFSNQNANLVLAGPSSGSAAAPSFRSLVAADIPSLASSKITNFAADVKTAIGISSGSTYLKKDGSWGTPTDTTYSAGTGISINNNRQISAIRPVPVCDTNGYVLTWDNEEECTWSDPSTLYSAGVGLSKSLTTFSLDPAFGVEFIIGTQTAQTGSWTGVSKQAALYDGMQIAYWLPFAGSGNATLNLTMSNGTTTGAVYCYFGGTSRLTTHFGAGNVIYMTYRSNVNIGGTSYTGWWHNADYNSTNTTQFRQYYTHPVVDSGSDFSVYRYQFILTTKSGTVVPYSNGNNQATTYTKTITTDAFDPFMPMYYYSYTNTYAAGVTMPSGYLWNFYELFDARYAFNIQSDGTAGTKSLTANLPVYIKAKYTVSTHTAVLQPNNSDANNYLAKSSLVQSLPSSNPGSDIIYIFIGYAHDKYRINLHGVHPIYRWDPNTNAMGIFSESIYSSKSAVSGGTDVSLVTTGEKYTWNNKISNPMTAANDIIVGGTNGAATKLVKGSNGTFLSINSSGNVAWVDNPVPFNGDNDNEVLMWDGTDEKAFWCAPFWMENLIFNAGEIIIGNSSGNPIALSNGSTGQVLTTISSGDRVAWRNATVRASRNTGSTALPVLLATSSDPNGSAIEAYYANTTNKQLKFTPSTGNLSGVAQINGSAVPSSPKFTDTTYTFASGTGSTNGFTVTPAGGSATTYTVGSLICNQDTRDTNTTPSTYYSSPNGALRFLGLKINSTIGIPTSVAGTYSGVLGLSPWSDSSGGHAWEFAFNQNGVYARHGASSWSSWAQVSFGSSSGYRPIQVSGTAIPATDTLNFIAGSNISISTQQSASTTRLVIDCTLVPCVIEGTLIRMADGTDKPVEELQNGDEILSWDPNSNKLCTAIVVCVRNTGKDKEFVTHIFDDGSYLTVYGEHVVYNKTKGYPIDIAKFEPGDETINVSGETIVYAGSIRHYCRYERKAHYDVNSSNNLYFAGGVLNGKMQFAKFRAMQDVGIKLSPEVQAIYEEHKAENEKDLGYEQNEEYIKQIASDFKQRSILAKAIEKAKKNLADSDYIVQKYTEGLISAIDWLKAKSDRAGWRKIVNDDETALAKFDTRINDAKNRFASRRSKKRSRYLQQCRIDNIHLEDYRAMFKKTED